MPNPNTYTAVTKQDGNWWIGWIEEVSGVNCQERSREELLQSLRASLSEALEFNRQDAIRAAESGYTEEQGNRVASCKSTPRPRCVRG